MAHQDQKQLGTFVRTQLGREARTPKAPASTSCERVLLTE